MPSDLTDHPDARGDARLIADLRAAAEHCCGNLDAMMGRPDARLVNDILQSPAPVDVAKLHGALKCPADNRIAHAAFGAAELLREASFWAEQARAFWAERALMPHARMQTQQALRAAEAAVGILRETLREGSDTNG